MPSIVLIKLGNLVTPEFQSCQPVGFTTRAFRMARRIGWENNSETMNERHKEWALALKQKSFVIFRSNESRASKEPRANRILGTFLSKLFQIVVNLTRFYIEMANETKSVKDNAKRKVHRTDALRGTILFVCLYSSDFEGVNSCRQ